MKTIVTAILVCLCFVGCSIFGGGGTPSYNFPSDIAAQCHGAKNNAKACIISVGTPLPKEEGCVVQKVAGEKKFPEGWGWRHGSIWALGLYRNGIIQIGVHPQTGGESSPPIIEHEFGHHWLASNGHGMGHDPMYTSCFVVWDYMSTTLGLRSDLTIEEQIDIVGRSLQAGSIVTLAGYDSNGDYVCIYGVVGD